MVHLSSNPPISHATDLTVKLQNKKFLPKISPISDNLWGVFSLDEANTFIVGENGKILRYNTDKYEFDEDENSGVLTTSNLYSVSLTDASNGVAVGEDGVILGWDGTTWSLSADSGKYPDDALLKTVHFGAFILACGVDAVTREAVILHKGWYYNAAGVLTWRANWEEVYRSKIGTGAYGLNGIGWTPDVQLFVVGGEGTVLRSTDWGNTWSEYPCTSDAALFFVHIFDTDFGFAGGENGTILLFDGSQFKPILSPVSCELYDCWLLERNFGFITGTNGVILLWDGISWREFPSSTGQQILSIHGLSTNFIFVCGSAGYIAQLLGEAYPSLPIDSAGNILDYRQPKTETIVNALEIRDTNAHNPDTDSEISIFAMLVDSHCAIDVRNTLDQSVSVQVMGSFTKSTTHAVTVGAAFNVASDDNEIRCINVDNAGWYPYLYLVLTCSVAPTGGSVSAYVYKKPME